MCFAEQNKWLFSIWKATLGWNGLTSKGLASGVKGRLYSVSVYSIVLHMSQTWPVKKDDVIALEKNDANMIRWMWSITPEKKISVVKLRNILQLHNMSKCLQNSRLLWLCHLKRIEDSFWPSKYRNFEIVSSLAGGRPSMMMRVRFFINGCDSQKHH